MIYIILSANTDYKLMAIVQKALNDEWKLVGGVSSMFDGTTTQFYQAMTQGDESKTKQPTES